MSTDNSTAWSDRGRAHEDEYFRRRDQELVESMFRRAEEEAAIQRLAAAVGVHDETTLRELQRLGYTADTAPLLYLVPPIEVAWADGLVSEAERNVVVAAAPSTWSPRRKPTGRYESGWQVRQRKRCVRKTCGYWRPYWGDVHLRNARRRFKPFARRVRAWHGHRAAFSASTPSQRRNSGHLIASLTPWI
jgi:hypothetical protein